MSIRAVVVLVPLVAGVALLAWWNFAGSAPEVVVTTAPGIGTETPAVVEQAISSTGGSGDRGGTATRAEVAVPDAAPPTSQTPVVPPRLIGRCVAPATKAPLSGCTVSVDNGQRHTLSGPDGRFSLDVHGLRLPFLVVLVAREDLCEQENHVGLPRQGTEDLGDIPMAFGAMVTGQVVDLGGAGVGAAQVTMLHKTLRRTGPGWSPRSWYAFSTGPDGCFRTPTALPAGNYDVAVPDHSMTQPSTFRVEAGQTQCQLVLTVVRRAADELIIGRVADTAGAPQSGVKLLFKVKPRHKPQDGRDLVQVSQATSDQSGRFRFLRPGHVNGDLAAAGGRIEVGSTLDFVAFTGDTIHWGATDVQVCLARRDLSVVDAILVVRAADSGQPIEDFEVEATRHRLGYFDSNLPRRAFAGGAHPDGRLTVCGLDDADYSLMVRPRGGAFCPTGFKLSLPGERGRELVCEIPKLVPLTVRVVDTAGAPVVGSTIGIARNARSSNGGRDYRDWSPMGITDAAGEVKTRRPYDDLLLYATVTGKTHVDASSADVSLPRDEAVLALVVSRGASLRGVVHPLARWTSLWWEIEQAGTAKGAASEPMRRYLQPTLSLLPSGALTGIKVHPDREGRFEISGLTEGEYGVAVLYPAANHQRHAFDLPQRLNITAAANAPVTLDISGLSVGTLQGRVLVHGMPRPDIPVMVRRELAAPPVASGGRARSMAQLYSTFRATTDGAARFALQRAQSGRYRVVTQAGRSPWVDFDANGGGPLDFDVLEQTLVIQLRDRAGRPLRGEQVIETSLGKKVTDAEGRLTWAPFGFQPVHLVFRPAGVGRGPGTEPQRLGPFAPKSGQRTTTLEVRVPD